MRVENNEIEVLHNVEEKSFSFENEEVLKSSVDRVRVRSQDRLFDSFVNRNLEKQQNAFLRKVHLNLFPSAVKDFKNSQTNNFFFAPYEAILTYTISYNQNCMLSFYYETYEFTGGAHGSTLRQAQTYNFKTRRKLQLWSFFENKINARNLIMDEIIKQANTNMQDNPGIYFDNYEVLIRKSFNPENFYLSPQGIVIFYNQYEIAPYSTGIVEFLIPYSVVDFPPSC